MHEDFGVHGDLKPEHVLTGFEGELGPWLLDPLGPLAGKLLGTVGWQLPLPGSSPPALSDLVAMAQIVGACWNDALPWTGGLAYSLNNINNGRFGRGLSLEALRDGLSRAYSEVPEPWRAWAQRSVDRFYASWQRGLWQPENPEDSEWIRDHLRELAAIPAWEGDDQG